MARIQGLFSILNLMGGKSYFCDYCRCYFKNDINVRKTHNDGLAHKIAKANYMRPFEDPRKILEEESAKQFCSRFPKGYCKFGWFCQYTHYNAAQLKQLYEIAKKLEQREQEISKNKSSLANKKQKRRKRLQKNLPPSLRPANIKNKKAASFINEWG